MIVGPFTGELGFELSIWLPYLRKHYGENLEGITAISRGQTSLLYPCPVINAYDVLSAQELQSALIHRMNTHGRMKPLPNDELDAEILNRLGLRSDLHPSRATAYRPWKDLAQYVRPIVTKPPKPREMPEKYVVVRIYKNDWLDDFDPEIIPELAEGLPVVVLVGNEQVDNHEEWDWSGPFKTAKMSLYRSVDSTIRSFCHAEKIITVYGGTCWLAQVCGKPVHALWNTGDDKYWNREMDEVFSQFAPMTVHRVKKA